MTKAADGEVPYTDEKLVAAADKIAEWAEKRILRRRYHNS